MAILKHNSGGCLIFNGLLQWALDLILMDPNFQDGDIYFSYKGKDHLVHQVDLPNKKRYRFVSSQLQKLVSKPENKYNFRKLKPVEEWGNNSLGMKSLTLNRWTCNQNETGTFTDSNGRESKYPEYLYHMNIRDMKKKK